MANDPISFIAVPSGTVWEEQENGSIVFYVNENTGAFTARLKWEGKSYQLLPEYNWNNIKDGFLGDTDAQNAIKQIATEVVKKDLAVSWLNYLAVEKSENDDSITLTFKYRDDETLVDESGIPLTTASITSGIEDGTFLVNDTPIKIAGLKSAAYSEADEFTPMSVSYWSDWQNIPTGGE